MAELIPADFELLVERAFDELEQHQQIYSLPQKKFFRGRPGYDLSVHFHDQLASCAVGPAAGPQTQLVQNIVLSYLAGGRIFELKTIQINDHLTIPRPCIDATNVGYNVEWSQELRLEASLREYVKAHMLLEMLRASGCLDSGYDDSFFADSRWIFDFSVGYDLKGIQHPKVVHFMRSMMNATKIVDELRPHIPARWKHFRDHDFETRIVESATLSTFHGCPSDEIEAISDFLLREIGLHVTVKMNPTLLGADRCESILRRQLGYEELQVAREHFDHDQKFEQMVPMVRRLQQTALEQSLGLGVKLTNTLVVKNHKTFFSDDVMYLSGAPLHVLTMNILQDVRESLGPDLPISFSAGIDARNFANAMACNLTPITVCTDLLRPGGYGRLSAYPGNLEKEMSEHGVRNVGDFVLRREGHGTKAATEAIAELRQGIERAATPKLSSEAAQDHDAALERFLTTLERRCLEAIEGSPYQNVGSAIRAVWKTRPEELHGILRPGREDVDQNNLYRRMVQLAAWSNTQSIVAQTNEDPRYRAEKNSRVPRKIGSKLVLYDCINCDKCIPVCPNDSNFAYTAETQDLTYKNYRLEQGRLVEEDQDRFVVEKSHQLANYADFCNECGNCDIFCPEDGGPFVEKPRFFSSLESWQEDGAVGFYVRRGHQDAIWGRLEDGKEHFLQINARTGEHTFRSGGIEVEVRPENHEPRLPRFPHGEVPEGTHLDMRAYHVLRTLLHGVLDPSLPNYINARTR